MKDTNIIYKTEKHKNKFAKNIVLICFALTVCIMIAGCSLAEDIIGLFAPAPSSSSSEISRPKVTAPPKQDGETLYGYDYLTDDKVKEIYSVISDFANRTDDRAKEVFVDGSVTDKMISQAECAFLNDNPEIFWLDSTFSYYELDGHTYIRLKYTMDIDSRTKASQQLNETVENIISKMPGNLDQLQKELYIHDYLVDNCEYDDDAAEDDDYRNSAFNAYGALVKGRAVCEGYTRAFNLLCKKLDIDCTNILGEGENEAHIWNAVNIGGEWYQIDVTWDDTGASESESDYITRYLYFNVSEATMCKDHKIGALYDEVTDEVYENTDENLNVFVPKCTAEDYNYYNYYSVELKDLEDADDVIYAIADAAKKEEKCVYIKLDENLNYDDTADQMINDGYIADWINSANEINSYETEIAPETAVYELESFRILAVEISN